MNDIDPQLEKWIEKLKTSINKWRTDLARFDAKVTKLETKITEGEALLAKYLVARAKIAGPKPFEEGNLWD